MRKILLIIVFALMLSQIALAVPTITVGWTASAETVRPGTDTRISLTITNGAEILTNVVITPSGGPYITPTSGKVDLGGMAAAGSQQASISLRVDKDAPSTNSYLYLTIDYYTGTSSSYQKTLTIPISIKREPILQIINVNYSDIVSPGKMLILSFDVKNSGAGPAEDLVVSLQQSDSYIVSQSAGEVVIDKLDAGVAIPMKFTIVIDPEADVGIDSISIDLKYYDETKDESYSETKYIGLAITGKVDFTASVKEAFGATATIEITNRGNAPAEYLTVKTKSGDFEKEYYIGTLDSDDSEEIEVTQPSSMFKYELEVQLIYKDKFNNEYSETKTLTVYPTTDMTFLVIIPVVAIIGAIYWFRKKKKISLLEIIGYKKE